MKEVSDILHQCMVRSKGLTIWKDIEEYHGYQISNRGQVRVVRNKILDRHGNWIVLTNPDKSRKNVNVKKAMAYYWFDKDQYRGVEKWKTINECYQISNYGRFKNSRQIVVRISHDGFVTLLNKEYRKRISVIKIYLNTFPPYEK